MILIDRYIYTASLATFELYDKNSESLVNFSKKCQDFTNLDLEDKSEESSCDSCECGVRINRNDSFVLLLSGNLINI